MYRFLLAVPFLIGVAVLQGLTVEIETFHSSDSGTYQLPTILQLSERLDLSDYPSAQTPLFHLVMAGWGELVGFELWKLRLLNVVISYGAGLALLRLLRRATPLGELPAFALTLAFVLSPYYFGASFTLLTDNLAILLGLVAMERVHTHARTGSPAAFAVACLAIGAAVFTRQSFLWLVPVAAFFLLGRPDPAMWKVLGLALLGLALVPLAALVVEWDGLVPPSADPASCGLCTDRPGVGRDALTLRTVGFTVAMLGVYAALVLGPALVRRARAGVVRLGPAALLALGSAAGAALLLASPLEYMPPRPPDMPGDAGYLWRLTEPFPTLLGSSLPFWALVPLGGATAAILVRRAGPAALPSVYLGAFLLAALPVNLVYQKYFDPFMLLAIALFARPGDLGERSDYAGIAVIYVASVAYALSFAG